MKHITRLGLPYLIGLVDVTPQSPSIGDSLVACHPRDVVPDTPARALYNKTCCTDEATKQPQRHQNGQHPLPSHSKSSQSRQRNRTQRK